MCKLPDGRGWLWEKLGLALVGRALVSKALTQLSADGWGRTPSLLVVRPSPRVSSLYGRVNVDLQRTYTKEDLPGLLLPESCPFGDLLRTHASTGI